MKVVIAGGSGFLGSALITELTGFADDLVVLSTRARPVAGARVIPWDGQSPGPWEAELDGAEAVVNYSGAPIFTRWTAKARTQILNSRVNSTKALAEAIQKSANPPRYWLNGSAIGYYGDRGSEQLTEASAPGDGFLAGVTQRWEAAARSTPSTKVGLLRTGVTLSAGHPPLSLLVRLTNNFAGGATGDGHAYFPWIWVKDHARLARFLIEHRLEGPVNAVAPHIVTNGNLMLALRKRLRRPWSPPTPAAVFKLLGALGFPAETVLGSFNVKPKAAQDAGFTWLAPTLEQALAEELRARR